MKDKKRILIYSALAVPLLAFGLFVATLDPAVRAGFWQEFAQNTKSMFAGDAAVGSAVNPEAAGNSGGGPAEAGGGGGGGGFDPVAVFERRDADGDGKLTGDEISERMRENLDVVDADKDAAITLEEFQSGMQTIFASGGGGGGGRGQGNDRAEGTPVTSPVDAGAGGEADVDSDQGASDQTP